MSRSKLLGFAALTLAAWLYFRSPAPEIESPRAAAKPAAKPSAPKPAAPRPALTPPTAPAILPPEVKAQKPAADPHQPPSPPPKSLPFKMVEGLVVSQGDILLGTPSEDDFPMTGFIEAPPLKLWPNRVIPFSIDAKVRNPERILRVIEYFNTHTPIRFQPYNNEKDSIVFTTIDGHCLSYLGRVGGAQPVFLDDRCGDQEITHELMHVLGFIHEHSRSDRDQYVAINWANIVDDRKDQFMRVPMDLNQPMKDRPFDFESVMIYSDRDFAKDRTQPTLMPRVGVKIEPQRQGLSAEDLQRLRILYR